MQGYIEMQVWDGVSGARIEFDWNAEREAGRDGRPIAFMNENLNLTSGLLKRIDELGGVEIMDGRGLRILDLGRRVRRWI